MTGARARTTDLRLVPAAGGAWAAAGVGVGLPPPVCLGLAAGLVVAGVVVLGRDLRRLRRSVASGGGSGRAGADGRRRARHRALGAVPLGVAGALAVAAVTLAVVAVAAAARTSGPWGELVQEGATATVEAVVRAPPDAVAPRVEGRSSAAARVRVDVRRVTGRGTVSQVRARVLVLGPGGWLATGVGERVRVTGRLVATAPADDVAALLVTDRPPQVVAPAGRLREAVATVRAALLDVTSGRSRDAAGLVPGITVGDTSRLPSDLEHAMRAVSLTHVTAVSGAHLAIVVGLVLGLSGAAPTGVRVALAVLVLAGIVVLVDVEPSVLRAAVMAGVTVLGLATGRPGRAAPALSVAVVALVLADPWVARSYGFVLSVLATAGLVHLAPVWARRLERVLPRRAAHAVAVPAAAQAVCGPVLVLLSPSLAPYAVPANLLAGPAVAPATVLGLLTAATAVWWPGAGAVLARGAGACTDWVAQVARAAAAAPGAVVPWPGGPGGAALLAAATIAVVVLVLRVRGARVPAARAVAGVLVVLLVLAAVPGLRRGVAALVPSGWPPAGWAVVMCDVGQGTAVAVRSGPDAAVLVDAGPPTDAAGRCLDALGVRRIDLLVLTHLHDDHVGGLSGVLAGRSVTRALLTPYAEPAAAEREVLELLAGAGVAVERPVAPAASASGVGAAAPAGRAGDVTWEVVWPTAGAVRGAEGADGTTVNDLSLAVVLEAPDVTVLATGDLETQAQAALAGAVRRARAAGEGGTSAASRLEGVDVLVVPHHGSTRQDPGLVALVSAPLALVSSGAGNPYGHPAPSALALIEEHGGTALRSDRCGSVAVLTHPLATVSGCTAADLAPAPAGSDAAASMTITDGRPRARRRSAAPWVPPIGPGP